MSNWSPQLHSSNIYRCRYFRRQRLLVIQFLSGSVYVYQDVPWSVYMGFRRASSYGSYHARHIRLSYRYMEVTDPQLLDLVGVGV